MPRSDEFENFHQLGCLSQSIFSNQVPLILQNFDAAISYRYQFERKSGSDAVNQDESVAPGEPLQKPRLDIWKAGRHGGEHIRRMKPNGNFQRQSGLG